MFSKLTSHVKSTYKNYLLRVSINLFFYLVPARLVDEKTDEAASVNNFADLHSIDHLADTLKCYFIHYFVSADSVTQHSSGSVTRIRTVFQI